MPHSADLRKSAGACHDALRACSHAAASSYAAPNKSRGKRARLPIPTARGRRAIIHATPTGGRLAVDTYKWRLSQKNFSGQCQNAAKCRHDAAVAGRDARRAGSPGEPAHCSILPSACRTRLKASHRLAMQQRHLAPAPAAPTFCIISPRYGHRELEHAYERCRHISAPRHLRAAR